MRVCLCEGMWVGATHFKYITYKNLKFKKINNFCHCYIATSFYTSGLQNQLLI